MFLSDLLEFLSGIVVFIVGLALAIFLLMVLWAWQVGPRACTEFGEGMKAQTEYKFWRGCFVTMPDGKVLPENIAMDVMRQEYRVEVKK